MKRSVLLATIVTVVAVTGCGSGDTPDRADAAAVAESPAATRSVVPDLRVTDVATGEAVQLRARVATDKPTLIWMWAPH